jgi:oxygen-independent coproporphyrinogen-3 oxidase
VENRAGIYIHIPFCERKCTYCNFNTTDFFEDLAARYIEAVSKEIKYQGEALCKNGEKIAVDTIFFGGGTPSIVESAQLEKLIEACHSSFQIAEDSEITIEINPSTFTRRKLEDWRAAGINRASVGVQSFKDSELVTLSRTHDASLARLTFESLRESGFQNISLDLIAGLPEQTLDDWQFNLHEALKLRPEHLSLYLLEVKEGTQLYSQIKRGQRPRPDDDLAGEMYKMICNAISAAGYEQYEISNFALISKTNDSDVSPFRSKHNMKYWVGAPFYGMGCGAHSYDGQARWVNILKTESYIDSVASSGYAIGEFRELSDEDRAAEALFMGLRLREGIDLNEFRAVYGLDVMARYGSDLARIFDAGLVEIINDRLRLTEQGMLLSNEVFIAFV